MAKKRMPPNDDCDPLPFPEGLPEREPPDSEPVTKRLLYPIWTENKAKLIQRYLQYFVFVTKHGTYIDGFAGPQKPDKPEMWAAKLVLESEPRWLRHFYLFDILPEKVQFLEQLKLEQPERDSKNRRINRTIDIRNEDFNEGVKKLLASGCISQKEATFCLLDQRTFECHWSTVEALARYKAEGYNKIELFYFLAVGWLGRSLKATTRDLDKLSNWWGRDDWQQFEGMKKPKQQEIFVNRIKKEFGYASVKGYPILSKQDCGTIMYYMIHATDHPIAPGLMTRAYHRAVFHETFEQMEMDFGELPPIANE